MSRRLPYRLSAVLAVTCFAAFLVLGGTGGAAVSQTPPKNSVGTAQLKNNAVTTPKIKNSAVARPRSRTTPSSPRRSRATRSGSAKIAANAVTTDKIAAMRSRPKRCRTVPSQRAIWRLECCRRAPPLVVSPTGR